MSYVFTEDMRKKLRKFGIKNIAVGTIVDPALNRRLVERIRREKWHRALRWKMMLFGIPGLLIVLSTLSIPKSSPMTDAQRYQMKLDADEIRYKMYKDEREKNGMKYINDLQNAARYNKEHGG